MVLTVAEAAAVETAVVSVVVETAETVVVSAVTVTTDLEVQDLKAITVAVNSFLYKKGGYFLNDRLFLCAVHGNQLGGASPLWGYVIANH